MSDGGWHTIESDAGVFTALIENMGVKNVQFEELIALDSSYLQNLSPVYGVIFLFRYPTGASAKDLASRQIEGTLDHDASSNMFFANQTIQNACATQAILSVLLNQQDVEVGPALKDFKEFTYDFPSDIRGEALSNSDLIRDVHNSFSRSSPFIDEQTRKATKDDDLYHFIAFSPINGVLYELDGLQPAPISHGPCTQSEFCDKIIPVLQRRIERYGDGEIRFNLMAMVQDLRMRAADIGDQETLMNEKEKRRGWEVENEMRRHNFVGFIYEVLKGAVEKKVGEGTYDTWILQTKKDTLEKMKKMKKEEDDDDDDDDDDL